MMNYEEVREEYRKLGVDTEHAIEGIRAVPISFNNWQLDIVLKVMSSGRKVRQTITSEDIRKIAKDFNLTLNEKFL